MDKNRFAITPPMGWNSYDYYDTTVNEAQVRANADYMAAHLKAFGWEYVVVDIEWYSNDAGTVRTGSSISRSGILRWTSTAGCSLHRSVFPLRQAERASAAGGLCAQSGIKVRNPYYEGDSRLAAQRHCPVPGAKETADRIADPSSICIWNPDMYGVRGTADGQAYYDSLLAMYAQWGVDFIKCDDICDSRLYRTEPFSGWEETRMIHRAIEKCGRPIVLSLSPGPAHIDRAWEYCRYANMWRITDDFWDEWSLLKAMFVRCEMWQDHVREGCFPDCDMLPLGKLGKGFGNGEWDTRFTREEQKTMMTLWCMFRSPLMIGAELTRLDDWTLSLLTNGELLAMLGENCSGTQLVRTEEYAVWKNKDEASGRLCVALFNLSDGDRELSIALSALGEETCEKQQDAALYEIWEKKESSTVDGRIVVQVPAHGVKVYRVGR